MSDLGNTVSGTEGMLHITNGLRGLDFEDYLFYFMSEYSKDVVLAALDLRAEWEADSNTPLSLAVEKNVAERILHKEHYKLPNRPIAELTSQQREAVIAIYDSTQRLLQVKNVSHIVLYRGLGWGLNQQPEWMLVSVEEGDKIRVDDQRPLSSWSFSEDVAEKYVRNCDIGLVIKAEIPVDRIFAIIDLDYEYDSVCISYSEVEEYEVVLVVKGEGSR